MKYKIIAKVPIYTEFYIFCEDESDVKQQAINVASTQFLTPFFERLSVKSTPIEKANLDRNDVTIVDIQPCREALDTGL